MDGFICFLILWIIVIPVWLFWKLVIAGRGTCANCKQSYKSIHWKVDGKKFCTKRCLSEYFRCEVCGAPSKYHTENGHFCSKNCQKEFLCSISEVDA